MQHAAIGPSALTLSASGHGHAIPAHPHNPRRPPTAPIHRREALPREGKEGPSPPKAAPLSTYPTCLLSRPPVDERRRRGDRPSGDQPHLLRAAMRRPPPPLRGVPGSAPWAAGAVLRGLPQATRLVVEDQEGPRSDTERGGQPRGQHGFLR